LGTNDHRRHVRGPRPRRQLAEDGGIAARKLSESDQEGVKIALGTDAGGFDWKVLNQAKEFEYYVQYGMTP